MNILNQNTAVIPLIPHVLIIDTQARLTIKLRKAYNL
ncbi:hypothetical protein FHR24_002179 [Wenyingzhuangia heitensis]|uniref:Uncharacterized protein n=1 Tax=Wenyingzhuangia heitensis TaxID=1487859 RepID=A0ABX0UBP7_9FLAO|nr:hypothetical protein [Wenyingzhuangia heitensis]